MSSSASESGDRPSEIKASTTEALLAAYVADAISHGDSLEVGDHQAANSSADALIGIYRELRRHGIGAQDALIPLLKHSDRGVRFWAASHALEFAPEEAERVLSGIAVARESLVAVSASIILRQWRDGDLKLP